MAPRQNAETDAGARCGRLSARTTRRLPVPAYGDPRQQVEHGDEHVVGELRRRQTHARGQVVGVDDDLHLPGHQPVVNRERPPLPGDQDQIAGLARVEHGGQPGEQVVDQRGERGRSGGGLGVAAVTDADVDLVVVSGADPGGASVVLEQRDRRLRRRLRPDQLHGVRDLVHQVVGQPAHRHSRARALLTPPRRHLRAARQIRGDACAVQKALTLGVVHEPDASGDDPGPKASWARPPPFRLRSDALGRLTR